MVAQKGACQMPDCNLSLLSDVLRDGHKQLTLTANPAGGFDAILSDRDIAQPVEAQHRDSSIGSGATLEAAIDDAMVAADLPY